MTGGASFSLLAPARDGQELPGLSDDACAVLQVHEDTTGHYTGERIKARNPQLYTVVCELLARGMTLLEVSDVTKLSRNTIRAIARAEAPGIDQRKQRLARSLLDLAEVGTASALQRIEGGEAISVKDLMIAVGIATDKGMLTAGEATTRVEHTQDVPDRDELLMMLSQQAKPADVIDTGTGARAAGTKGEAAAGSDPAAGAPGEGAQ